MQRASLLILIFALPLSIFAQTPIHYSLFTSELYQASSPRYGEGKSALRSAFPIEAMNAYRKHIADYLKDKEEVMNFVSPEGMRIPMAFPHESLEGAKEVMKNSDFIKVGDMYVPTYSLEKLKLVGKDQLIGPDYYFRDMAKGMSTGLDSKKENVRSLDFALKQSSGLAFTETWQYSDGNFIKNVIHAGLLRDMIRNGDLLGMQNFILFECFANGTREGVDYDVFAEDVVYDVLFNSGESAPERMQELLYATDANGYISAADKFEIMSAIFADLDKGKIKVHTYDQKLAAQIGSEVGPEQFIEGFNHFEETYVEDSETGEKLMTQTVEPILLKDVVGFRFIEDWYLPSAGFGIQKQVKGLTFLVKTLDDQGNIIGTEPLPRFVLIMNN